MSEHKPTEDNMAKTTPATAEESSENVLESTGHHGKPGPIAESEPPDPSEPQSSSQWQSLCAEWVKKKRLAVECPQQLDQTTLELVLLVQFLIALNGPTASNDPSVTADITTTEFQASHQNESGSWSITIASLFLFMSIVLIGGISFLIIVDTYEDT